MEKPFIYQELYNKAKSYLLSFNNTIQQDLDIHLDIEQLRPKENNVSHYAVAKLFWLVGTGDFHLSGKKVGAKGNELIARF